MTGLKTGAIVAASMLVLAGCENRDFFGDGKVFDSWTQEAGAFLDEGQFGNPTRQNFLVQTGKGNFIVNLNNRFSSEVNPMVNFDFDSARLDEEAKAILRKQADWIRQFPEVRFKVFGHTDLVGTDAYNKRLGLRRARAVVNYLVSQGISRSRLAAVVSYGESQPLIVTQKRERRNRRTVTEVAGLARKQPAPLNGKYAELLFREYVESATELPKTGSDTLQQSGN